MSKPEETPGNGEKPTEKPIRDIVTGPDFVYIQNSDHAIRDLINKIPDIKTNL